MTPCSLLFHVLSHPYIPLHLEEMIFPLVYNRAIFVLTALTTRHLLVVTLWCAWGWQWTYSATCFPAVQNSLPFNFNKGASNHEILIWKLRKIILWCLYISPHRSVGATVVEMLTGKRPFAEHTEKMAVIFGLGQKSLSLEKLIHGPGFSDEVQMFLKLCINW